MKTLRGGLLTGLGLVVMVAALLPPAAEAGGPWKGRVVDAETGAPLEGTVVLMYWIRYSPSLGGWAGGDFFDAAEVLTGPDGGFEIPARRTFSWIPGKKVSREIVIFKPGHGHWRFRGSASWPRDVHEVRALSEKAWEDFEGGGVEIELPPLKTRDERLTFLGQVSYAPVLPSERTKLLDETRDQERAYLGLPGSYRSKP